MPERLAFLAAGGTGGHLFPAAALAHELVARGWRVHLVTDRRARRFAEDFPAEEVHAVDAATFGSKNPVALLKSGWTIWRGVRQSSTLIGWLRPAVVIGFGGYPTLPPLYAAIRAGVPTLIHEQNAVMGRANRVLSGRVDAIAGGFLSPKQDAVGDKIVVTGNPVRPAVIEAAKTAYETPETGGPFRLLVFGGSQGAQFFAQAIPSAIAALADDDRSRIRLMLQARTEDEAAARDEVAHLGIDAEVAPFFSDMARRIGEAHLVVSRSGASTVSEIAVIGRPAILVPYPHALDHDQAANAAALAAAGGAEVHPQSSLDTTRLSDLIAGFMQKPERLSAMAAAARSAGRSDAARLLADLTEAIASGSSVEEFKGEMRP